jgi:hypothetical protein
MNYADARSQIETGDLIAVRDVHGILGRLTVFFTHKPVTHTGVVRWSDGLLYMADLNSGRNHLTALSQLVDFDVYDPPAGLDRTSIREAIDAWLAKPINYGIAAFVLIGLKCLLRLKVYIHWRRVMVCSGGSVNIYEMAAAIMLRRGLKAPPDWIEHNRMLSPGELASELRLKLAIRGSDKSTNQAAHEAVSSF